MIDSDDDGDPGEVVWGEDDDYLPDPASPNHFYHRVPVDDPVRYAEAYRTAFR